MFFSALFSKWGDVFSDLTLANAILDRLLHHSHIVKTGVVKINPIVINSAKNVGSINMNTALDLSGTHLLNTKFLVTDYSIADRYMYTYTTCTTKDNCHEFKDIISRESTSETILVLTSQLTLDSNSAFSKSSNAQGRFGSTFLKIEYSTLDGMKVGSLNNVTPKTYTSGYILKAPASIEKAEKLNLLVTIRDKRYRIALKS